MGVPFTLMGRTYTDADFAGFGYVDAWPAAMAGFQGEILAFQATAQQVAIQAAAVQAAVLNGPVTTVNGMTGAIRLPETNNRVINGDWRVSQRGTSFSVSASQYTLDRCFAFVSGGATLTVSQQAAQDVWLDRIPSNYLRAVSPAGSGQSYLSLRVEDVRTYAGKRIVWNMKARGASGTTVVDRVVIFQNFGTGGDAAVTVATFSNIAVTTAVALLQFAALLPDVSGKSIGAGSYLELRFYTRLGTTDARSFDIGDHWIDDSVTGQSPTGGRFDDRPMQAEQALCERYHERIPVEMSFVATAANQTVRQSFALVRKAKSPALVFATAGTLTNGSAALQAGPDPTGGFTVTLTSTAAGLVSLAGAIVAADAEL